ARDLPPAEAPIFHQVSDAARARLPFDANASPHGSVPRMVKGSLLAFIAAGDATDSAHRIGALLRSIGHEPIADRQPLHITDGVVLVPLLPRQAQHRPRGAEKNG